MHDMSLQPELILNQPQERVLVNTYWSQQMGVGTSVSHKQSTLTSCEGTQVVKSTANISFLLLCFQLFLYAFIMLFLPLNLCLFLSHAHMHTYTHTYTEKQAHLSMEEGQIQKHFYNPGTSVLPGAKMVPAWFWFPFFPTEPKSGGSRFKVGPPQAIYMWTFHKESTAWK